MSIVNTVVFIFTVVGIGTIITYILHKKGGKNGDNNRKS